MSILRNKLPKSVQTIEEALLILSDDSWGKSRSWGVIDVNREVIIRKGYHEGSSGGDSSDYDELPIHRSVISSLKSSGYVKGTAQWGYTDDTKLIISEYGERKAGEIHKLKGEGS